MNDPKPRYGKFWVYEYPEAIKEPPWWHQDAVWGELSTEIKGADGSVIYRRLNDPENYNMFKTICSDLTFINRGFACILKK